MSNKHLQPLTDRAYDGQTPYKEDEKEKTNYQQREDMGCSRVQRFRQNLREQDCGRLDVWIGGAWVRGLVFLAQHQKRPLWAVVQDAVKPYLAQNNIVFNRPPKDRSR
jgi:hypothetical protein